MKIQNLADRVRLCSSIFCVFTALICPAKAETLTWTNVTGGNLLWSNSANWTNSLGANATPTGIDVLRFDANGSLGPIGATNAPGLVNNIIGSSVTVTSLVYLAFNPGYHTTLLNPGTTLTIADDPTVPRELFTFRHGFTASTNLIGYITIKGDASIAAGDPNNPATGSGSIMRVHATSTHVNSAALATLDMSGLNNFSIGVAEIKIGGQGAGQATRGRLVLARTNLLVSAISGSGNVGFLIGSSTGTTTTNTTDSFGDVQLGQHNEIRVNNLKIGGSRTSLGSMEFQSGLLPNPTLVLRDSTGNNPINFFSIGDNFDGPNNANYNNAVSTGIVDLSGGTVDAFVNNLVVGRNINVSTTSRNCGGNGVLTWAAGHINATTLSIGVQAINNAGSSVGEVNVRSNATLFVDTLNLGGDQGTAAGTGVGTLNIVHGAQATVTNNILEVNVGANSGTSSINITNSTLAVGGLVRVDNLIAQNATINLTVSPSITPANPVCNLTNTLTLLNSVTINLSGNGLTLTKYPLIKYVGSIGGGGFGVVSLGSLPANTAGYLTNNTATSSIDLVVTNVPAVKWNGNLGSNWDVNNTVNWINTITSTATTYMENSFPGDPVVFDDSAIGTKTVNLTTTLFPATVTVNSAATYSFIGTGGIGGPASLLKTGNGTLEVANSGVNDFSGGTLVVGGTLRVDSSISGSGAMLISAGSTLSGTGVISSPLTIGASGMLAVGNGIGTLTVNNSFTLLAGSTNIFEVNIDTLEHDQVAGSGFVTYGGTLVLSLSGGGTALTNGAAIQLFSTPVGGSFSAIVPTYPAPGFYWDTSTLAVDGTLRILPVPAGNLLTWTHSGGDLLWSNPANWLRTNPSFPGSPGSNSVPTADDSVMFGGALGLTNTFGAVNNIVDSSQTVSNYTYSALTANGYHTTLIQPGATLTVNSSQLVGNEFNVNVQPALGQNEQMYASIRGTNASFVVGIPSVLNTSFGLSTYATSTNTDPSLSSHHATLDLAGLDNFQFWGGFILVAGSGSPGTNDQPSGSLLLARTNVIVAGRSSAVSSAGTIRIANCLTGSGTGQSESLIELGQENTICAEYLRIGGAQAVNGGAIRFRSGLSSPTLKLRAPDQFSRMQLLTVGDNFDVNTAVVSVAPSTGVLNLTGGIVDGLVDVLHVGRAYGATTTSTRTGNGTGLLTFSGGTLDVTTLNIGCQPVNNMANSTGLVLVANSGLLVAGTINIGRDAGSSNPQTGVGVLTLAGGTVSVTGNILENNAGGGNGSSTINLTNGYLSVGGAITVDNVNAISGIVSNVGLMTVGSVGGNGTIAGSMTVLTSLSPGTSIGTLTNFGDLVLSAGSTNIFEVNIDTLAHDLVTGMNSVTYGGTLVISPIGLGTAVTNGASAKLFNAATYSGSFAAIVPTTPGPGLAWDTSQLTVNGTLRVIGVNTTLTSLTFAMTGGNVLDISWPADHTGWRLEGQTNAINVGISTNWFTVPGSSSTNHVSMPFSPANGAVFYRLVYP